MLKFESQKGQTLVGIIVLLVLGMGLVVTISNSFLKNLTQVTKTDTGSRANAVAEAGIERLLVVDTNTLENYIINNNCGSVCTISIPGNDGNTASATVTLAFLGNTTTNYPVELTTDTFKEINLKSYPNNTDLYICWDSTYAGSNAPSVYGLFVNGLTGSYNAQSYAVNAINSTNTANKFSTAYAAYGFANCLTVTGQPNPQLLRLKSYYNAVTVYIVPANGQIVPKQGVVITSLGTFMDSNKKIVATKAGTTLPSQFDYVLYQKSLSDPLSN